VIHLLVPLIVVTILLLPILLSPVSRRASLFVSRIAVPVFGDYVADSPRRHRQVSRLRETHTGTTHRVYAARTLLFSGVAGVVGAVLGVYTAGWLVSLFDIGEEAIRDTLPAALSFLAGLTRLAELGVLELFALLLFFGATVGAVLALGTYWGRWAYLDQAATARASEIEATLPRTIAFVYALSRSGMPFPKVLETLATNEAIYGEAATEVRIAVRDMDTFSTDILTALNRTADRTPSEGLEEFADNLASVLGSGRNLSSFLREQYERYREEAESQQEQYLELVSTFAEVYVTVFVAGPLFLITVLAVVGLVLENTLPLVRFLGYAAIPLGTFGFIVWIDSLTQDRMGSSTVEVDVETAGRASGSVSRGERGNNDGPTPAVSDGGSAAADTWRRNAARLAAYDRFRRVRGWLDAPLRHALATPAVSFLVTVPLGLAWVLFRSVPIPLGPSALQTLDHPVMEATVFALAVFALLHELHRRRLRRIERAVPDFLDRLASVNEAGMTVVESLERIAGTELGGLQAEIDRTWLDVRWGAETQQALKRLAARTRTRMVSRAVTLITNAMDASGDVAPVLRIAADEAQETRRLQRERRQEMLTYVLVIYISVFVFLGIIVALSVAFIPAVQSAGAPGGTGGGAPGVGLGGIAGGVSDVNTAAYELLFFHIAMVQAGSSGFVAGKLAGGGIGDGAKHATVLLGITYIVFTFV
jgi:flagellar protein FlaJ